MGLGIASKLRHSVRRRGVLGTAGRAARRLAEQVRTFASPLRRRERRLIEQTDRDFDGRHGVETGGFIPLDRLGVSPDGQNLGTAYSGTPPDLFRAALAALPIDYRSFTFVDFGSGKGRAVLMAAGYPFKRVVGVEFSPVLHRIAERNLATYRGERRCGVRLECADATTFPLPDGPLVCYFANPFQRDAMALAVDNVRASVERRPRPVYVVYFTPVLEDVLAAAPFLEKAGAGDLFSVYRTRVAARRLAA